MSRWFIVRFLSFLGMFSFLQHCAVFMARMLNNRRRCILWSPGGDRRSRFHLAINSCNWEISDFHANFGPSLQKACQIENQYWVLGSLTWTFSPISNDFDSQGMAASRAAYYPHILRASRQNAACRRAFCALIVNLIEALLCSVCNAISYTTQDDRGSKLLRQNKTKIIRIY